MKTRAARPVAPPQADDPTIRRPPVRSGIGNAARNERLRERMRARAAQEHAEASSGRALPGHDQAIVHDDDEAHAAADAAGARAFTWGADIFFARGAYQPGTDDGDALLRHELAHVSPTSAAGQAQGLSHPGQSTEAAADTAERGGADPGDTPVSGGHALLQRKPADDDPDGTDDAAAIDRALSSQRAADVLAIGDFSSASTSQRADLLAILIDMWWSNADEEACMVRILASSGGGLSALVSTLASRKLLEPLLDHVDDDAQRDQIVGLLRASGHPDAERLIAESEKGWLDALGSALGRGAQVVGDATASVTEAPQHIGTVLGETWDHIKEHWVAFVATFLGLLAAELVIGALAAAPEPTMATKVVAYALQVLVILVMGSFAALEAKGAVSEASAWLSGVWDAHGDQQAISEASLSFCRMMLHVALAVLALIGVRSGVRNLGRIGNGGVGGTEASTTRDSSTAKDSPTVDDPSSPGGKEPTTPKLRPGQGLPEAEVLSNAGKVADRGGLTRAGRAFQKHGSRNPDIWGQPTGGPAEMNAQGQAILDEIISNSSTTWKIRHHARFGDVIEAIAPDGRGLRWDDAGGFLHGFLDPR